jgi:hypothetical protein
MLVLYMKEPLKSPLKLAQFPVDHHSMVSSKYFVPGMWSFDVTSRSVPMWKIFHRAVGIIMLPSKEQSYETQKHSTAPVRAGNSERYLLFFRAKHSEQLRLGETYFCAHCMMCRAGNSLWWCCSGLKKVKEVASWMQAFNHLYASVLRWRPREAGLLPRVQRHLSGAVAIHVSFTDMCVSSVSISASD